MEERDQKSINDELTASYNYELATGAYEPTCRLRINKIGVSPGMVGTLQQMYINKSTGKTYWRAVETGYFQD